MEHPSYNESLGMAGEPLSSDARDALDMARMGKKQTLKRRFGFWSVLGFACSIAVTWEGALIVFVSGLLNGGSGGLLYGYIFVWIGTLAVFMTMSELVSMAPTSGGQYHWAYMLAPTSSRKFISYITGWLVMAGWEAFAASGVYLTATLIQGLIVLNNEHYDFKRWHGTLIYCAIMVFALFINVFGAKLLPKIESAILFIHLTGFVGVLVTLVYLTPHNGKYHNASDVFTVFLNEGGWPTQGLSIFVGLIGNVFALFGTDCATHMSEEIVDASIIVPRTMITSVILNGALGFGMMIAVLFCAGNLDSALQSQTGYPFLEIFTTATGSVGIATGLAIIITLVAGASSLALLATASRLVWAYARDQAVPFWRQLGKVGKNSSVPVSALVVCTILACLLSLINIGSAAAFNDVISLAVSSLYASYIIVESLLLYRRCTDSIRVRQYPASANPKDTELYWGPYRIPGALGVAINTFAVVFSLIIFFFSFWPSATPVKPATMNFSVVVTAFVLGFSVIYYLVWARKQYTGPIIQV